jgi:ribosomal protein S18 acetylase RimI-like enzyme
MAAVATKAGPLIRPLAPADRDRVEAITRAVGVFRENEIPVALEVFDGATGANGKRLDPDYRAAGIEQDGRLLAWACWGPTPGTAATFDLYWIVVDPGCQGCGLGTLLLDEMERRIAGTARVVVIVTSGRADYGNTRAFYLRHGYSIKGTIEDYYGPGDDQVIFAKRFQ